VQQVGLTAVSVAYSYAHDDAPRFGPGPSQRLRGFSELGPLNRRAIYGFRHYGRGTDTDQYLRAEEFDRRGLRHYGALISQRSNARRDRTALGSPANRG